MNELHKNVRTAIRKADLIVAKPAKVSSLYDANVEGYLTKEWNDIVTVQFVPINDAHEGYRLPWLTNSAKATIVQKKIQEVVDVLQAAGFATTVDSMGYLSVGKNRDTGCAAV